MTSQALLYYIGSWLLTYSAVIGTASVVMHLRVDWMHSQMGRHLMAYMAVIAAVLAVGAIRFFTGDDGDSFGFVLLRLIVFLGVPIVLTQRLWLQWKAQRQVDSDKRNGK